MTKGPRGNKDKSETKNDHDKRTKQAEREELASGQLENKEAKGSSIQPANHLYIPFVIST